jgi:hypothetical protein
MKISAPETRALVRLLSDWDPHMTVDLHTTNGSVHAYHLTYSIPLNPMVDQRLLDYHRDTMMPVIAKAMLDQHKFRTYYYGDYSGPAQNRVWTAFQYWPCVGQNYVGLRNRFTILSEAYSYASFKRRVEVTEAFVLEICNFMAAHGAEMDRLAKQVDLDATRRGRNAQPFPFGVTFQRKALPNPVDMLEGEVKPLHNPRITNANTNMRAMVEETAKPVKVTDYALWTATKSTPAAMFYLVQPDASKPVIEKLRQHGVTVESLTEPLTTEVDAFAVESANRRNVGNKGTGVVVVGKYEKQTVTFPTGSVVVRAAQPLGLLAAILMEPESDDGVSWWGFLGESVAAGKAHPVYKLNGALKAATRVVD